MDLNEVLVFAKVVEAGSFVGAAAALGMPKTTVSHRIRSLEDRLGARLLQRTTRRMSLTEAGTAYYERCQRILVDLEDAEAAVGQLLEAPRGLLRIVAPVAFTQHLLAPLLPRFMREHPAVRIRLTADNVQRTPVASGHDLAIRVGHHEDNELVTRLLCRASLGLYASKAYLDERGEPTSPEDLHEHRLLVNAAGATEVPWTLRRGSVRRDVRPQGWLVSNDMVAVRAAVREGLGIALLPDFLLRGDVARGQARAVLARWSLPVMDLCAVYPSRRFVSPKVRVALDFLAENIPALLEARAASAPAPRVRA